MLDVRRLRVLSEVAARGSFSAAAGALTLTQSAVSQHVATLEREVGLPLVERGTRPVELTEAGHALTRHAAEILARLDSAEQELGEISGRRVRRLRFGSIPTALATIVPPALQRFRRAHADVTLTVVDDHLQHLLPRLRARELDLALVYDHEALAEVARDVECTPLLADVYRVVLPPRHRLARRRRPLSWPTSPASGGSAAGRRARGSASSRTPAVRRASRPRSPSRPTTTSPCRRS